MIRTDKNPEYFLEVARTGSISGAAKRLFISQPYLSQYILRLEESFQVKLLDREKTPLELTPAGKIYASYLESGLQMYHKLLQDFDGLREGGLETIRVGLTNWRSSTLLPAVLPAFTERYPQVKLQLLEVPNRSLYELIAADRADCVIMNTTLNIPASMTSEVLLYEKILLVGHRDNPTTQQLLQMQIEGITPDLHLLESERVILLQPESDLAARVLNYLDREQVVLRNVLHTDNAATALNLTARNFGFCFLNSTGVRSAPDREDLAFFDLGSEDLVHPLCAVYRKDTYLHPAARDLIDMTTAFFKEQR